MRRKFYQLEHTSLSDLGAATHKELWEKVKAKGYDGLAVSCETILTKDADNKFHAVFSTADEDRHGDVVEQNWDLKSYKKNPVYLDSHNYDSIEHIIGRVSNIKSKDGELGGDIEFALRNPRGELAHNLAEDGFLNTSSVGFIPKEFDDKGRIIKSELLEISGVSVPANPHALFEKQETETETTQEPTEPEITPEAIAETTEEQPQEEPETPVKPEPVKPTPEQVAASAVRSIAQERATLLTNVLSAVRSLSKQPKVETPVRDRAMEKRQINALIRELIKQKNQIK